MRYVPSPYEGGAGEDSVPGRLQLFVESSDPLVMDYADNITVAPWGHLIVCEDRLGKKANHVKGITPGGRIYAIARLNRDTELAGVCFSPDGSTMFVNIYHPGKTLAITGPWNALRTG
jgi:secreted PhoX family phosphatase